MNTRLRSFIALYTVLVILACNAPMAAKTSPAPLPSATFTIIPTNTSRPSATATLTRTATLTSTPLPTDTPTPTPRVYDGVWSGKTAEGIQIALTVVNNNIQEFRLNGAVRISCGDSRYTLNPGYRVTITSAMLSATPPSSSLIRPFDPSVSDGVFSVVLNQNDAVHTLEGKFVGFASASGTYRWSFQGCGKTLLWSATRPEGVETTPATTP